MKQRVFLVADRRRLRELVVDLFSSSGDFQLVGTANTEAEAWGWLQEHPEAWDVAVMDIVLDEGDGTHVIRYARERHVGGLISVLSNCVTDNLREHCYALGADTVFDEKDTARFILWLDRVGGAEPVGTTRKIAARPQSAASQP